MYILSFQLEQVERRIPRIWCNHRLPPTQPKRTSHHIQTPLRTLHIIARCPHLTNLWEEIWQNGTCIQDQLYGEADQLRRTANSFISNAGVSVWVNEEEVGLSCLFRSWSTWRLFLLLPDLRRLTWWYYQIQVINTHIAPNCLLQLSFSRPHCLFWLCKMRIGQWVHERAVLFPANKLIIRHIWLTLLFSGRFFPQATILSKS